MSDLDGLIREIIEGVRSVETYSDMTTDQVIEVLKVYELNQIGSELRMLNRKLNVIGSTIEDISV